MLPTEAQWEYACRAGSPGPWSFNPLTAEDADRLLDEYAWFNVNARAQTHIVAQKRASVWGLYDMYGNVWEWCQDWYDPNYYAKSPTDDPTGPPQGSVRVLRGGCWGDTAWRCRSALRYFFAPTYHDHYQGLRVSLVPADK
jgi:formylglycine-generating enzyme required for sulfatase activity